MNTVVLVMTIIFSIGAVGCIGFTVYNRELRRASRKVALVPKVNFPEEGVCQCGDAFCYHAGALGCKVANCPCQMFISSTIHNEEIDKMTIMAIAARTAEMEKQALTHRVETKRQQAVLERGY